MFGFDLQNKRIHRDGVGQTNTGMKVPFCTVSTFFDINIHAFDFNIHFGS